jgi:hypothetical protein
MREQRARKAARDEERLTSIDQLQLDLAGFNRCIEILEKADADPHDIELLTTHALMLAERIDEVRWSRPAEALGWLFEKAILQRR